MGKMTTEEFVSRVTNKRKDLDLDYSRAVYKGTELPITVTCKMHGDFTATPHELMGKKVCPECSRINRALIGRSNTEEFIQKARKIHGDKYDYSKVNYETNSIKVEIICPQHGSFLQSPNSHLREQECPDCGEIKGHKSKIYTKEEYLTLVKAKHGNRYDYSLVEYSGCFDKIKIKCPEHGIFEQKASQHLFGRGCKACGNIPKDSYRERYANQFLEKVAKLHNNFFDYTKTEYTGAHNKVTFTCPLHGDITVKANSHLNGYGCKACAKEKSGFGRSNFVHSCKRGEGILYLIECYNEDERFYKIGITGKTVDIRYADNRDLPYHFTLLKEIKGLPEDIWNLEKKNLRLVKPHKYTPKLDFKGKTECFTLEALDKIQFELPS